LVSVRAREQRSLAYIGWWAPEQKEAAEWKEDVESEMRQKEGKRVRVN
jgi:hypothetical protein